MSLVPETIAGTGFQAEVIRTDRVKTASIRLEAGKVSVVVPRSTPTERIESLLRAKDRWIREKLLLHREHAPSRPKEYVSGEAFAYLGKHYRLKVEAGGTGGAKLRNGYLCVGVPSSVKNREASIRQALEAWYRQHALAKLEEKTARYAKLIGVEPQSVAIKTFRGRWGSCSRDGKLVFNWMIIVAPHRIVDYVVVHELCHLRHHDHSPVFWRCVEGAIPDYRVCRAWLKANARRLEL